MTVSDWCAGAAAREPANNLPRPAKAVALFRM